MTLPPCIGFSLLPVIQEGDDDDREPVDALAAGAGMFVTLTGDGASGVSEPSLFQRVGADWVLKAPESVCGTFSPGDSRPNDSAVPEAIWEAGCVIA